MEIFRFTFTGLVKVDCIEDMLVIRRRQIFIDNQTIDKELSIAVEDNSFGPVQENVRELLAIIVFRMHARH